ncbi:MAG: hypothetical protein ACJ790_06655 [Myxococcaceae bacterium]
MLLAPLLIALSLPGAVNTVTAVGSGAALTLPVQRHMVRIVTPDAGPVWLLALQQEGATGHGLGMFRSLDEGASWTRTASIQDNSAHLDRAELIAVGTDLLVLYSLETFAGSPITGSTLHDVVLQHWTYAGAGTWTLSSTTRVFDSVSASTAYYRATMAFDSVGRLWVQGFKLEANGTHSVVVAVSTNGGATFSTQTLGTGLVNRAGGRIQPVAGRMIVLFDEMDAGTPARYFIRSDTASLTSWSGLTTAFAEGIYHGAAMSLVTLGSTMHVVYKDEAEVLRYRTFNGTAFSGTTLIDSKADWAMQPSLVDVAGDLFLFWNHQNAFTSYDLRLRRMTSGVVTILVSTATWKGYLATPEHLSGDSPQNLCAFGDVPDPNSAGNVRVVNVPRTPTEPPPDAGVPPPPFDAGVPPPVDAGVPPPTDGGTPGGVLFSDSFNRANGGLGPNWTVAQGLFVINANRAASDLDGADLALENPASCRDCRVQSRAVGFGVPQTSLALRAQGSPNFDRYELTLTGTGNVQVRRIRGGVATILGTAASGIADLTNFATLSLTATGAGPVTLTARVNGVTRLTVTDTSTSAIVTTGRAGLATNRAGVAWDDFQLSAAP